MSETVRVALDAMGGDRAPGETVLGAIEAAREYGIGVYLVGQAAVIQTELAKHDTNGLDLPIEHTDEVIPMDEHNPARAVRNKNTSMVRALQLVKDGLAIGAVSAGNSGAMMAAATLVIRRIKGIERGAIGGVSAGNSGAMMAAATLVIRRIKGIERGAIGGVLPTRDGICMLIDLGANTDCRPEFLQQFALMGSIYMERIMHLPSPRVGLLSNGEEENKGNQLVQETHQLLKTNAATLGINFIGNVEGRDIFAGPVDVVVCDGFVGNVVLKLTEGLSDTLLGMIRAEMTRSLPNKLAAAVLRSDMSKLAKRLDYAEHGGFPLLGINGSAIIAHGRSNATAIKNALRVARET
ncbi:MAG: hypothetical protein AUH94_07865, partial [Ktedonobacter sp. 13_2_20CM_2_54_8]